MKLVFENQLRETVQDLDADFIATALHLGAKHGLHGVYVCIKYVETAWAEIFLALQKFRQ